MAVITHIDNTKVKTLFGDQVNLPADTVIDQFIEEAAVIVSEYDIAMVGQTSDVNTAQIINWTATFINKVKAGARVKNISTLPFLTSLVSSDPTADDVIELDDDIFTGAGQTYWIEDLYKIELAEAYKAASFLIQKEIVNDVNIKGFEKKTLGPMSTSMGTNNVLVGRLEPRSFNIFEEKFFAIVGPTIEAMDLS